MQIDIQILIWSSFLGLAHILLATSAATKARGILWNVGPRDIAQAPLTGAAARLQRASENFKETFPLFLAAIVASYATGRAGTGYNSGVLMYFFGRLLYLPMYAFGITYARTAVWGIATFGIVLMFADIVV